MFYIYQNFQLNFSLLLFLFFLAKAHLESYAIKNGFEFIKKTGLVYTKKKFLTPSRNINECISR